MQKGTALMASLAAVVALAGCNPKTDDAQAPTGVGQPPNAVQGLEPAPQPSTPAPDSAAPDAATSTTPDGITSAPQGTPEQTPEPASPSTP